MTLSLSTKDDRREEPAALAPGAKTPTAAEYRAILVKHRRTQLQHTRENLQRLAQSYDRAADAILERVRALPDKVERTGVGWLRAQLNAMQGIRQELERFRTDYAGMLDLSMISSAQEAADREAEVARLVGAPDDPRLFVNAERSITLSTGQGVSVQFGRLAKEAVEGVANRYYRDGIQLSQRLYKLSSETRQQVENTIVSGIASGTSARDMALQLQQVLSADGADTPLYRAKRIAITETNHAFREAHTRSTMEPSGALKSYIVGIRWSLSASHKDLDMCDCYAVHDGGLGPGVYEPDDVPGSHPHCRCYQTSEMREFPGVIPPGKKPNAEEVPESVIRYAAEKEKDPVAIARLAQAGR